MSALGTVAAIAVTLGGIGRLAATDPKRRRSFDLPPYRGNRQVALALTAVFLPGVLLIAIGTGADFLAWLGAICVVGWGVAAISPWRTARVAAWIAATASALRGLAASLSAAASRLASPVLEFLKRSASAGRRPAQVSAPSASRAAARAIDDGALRRIAELERRVALLEAALADSGAERASADRAEDWTVARLADFQGAKAQRAGDR